MKGAQVLIIDDDEDISQTLSDRLVAGGCHVNSALDANAGLKILRQVPTDLVLLDLRLPDMTGHEVLQVIEDEEIDVTVVMMTAHASIPDAVSAIKSGAYDFIQKPFELDQLTAVINRAVERQQFRRELAFFRENATANRTRIIGESTGMERVVKTALRAAPSQATVLILGESGTGKELLANLIHENSPRNQKPFVAVNCVALSKQVLESELFGHERGAFTGAIKAKRGRFEQAREGTIFLDEIGSTDLDFQLKLLRVIQERTFERVGGDQTLEADIRILAATNRDLEQAVAEGSFLKDLYYRLNVITLHLPPLRDRLEDVPALATHFLNSQCITLNKEITGFTTEALPALTNYAWPGNVRELENVVERAAVLSEGNEITLEDLPEALIEASPKNGNHSACSYHEAVKQFKRQFLADVLERYDGNQTRAATELGMQRSNFNRLLGKLGIRGPGKSETPGE